MQKDFGAARTLLAFVEGVGWLAVGGGALFFVFRVSDSFTRPEALIGLAVAVAGFLMVATAQLSRAIVATAENTGRIAELLERRGRAPSSGSAGHPDVRMSPAVERGVYKETYKGVAISDLPGGKLWADGQEFHSLTATRSHIDSLQ